MYWHHGIYVSDDRVIEFGGGTAARKDRSVVRRVTLTDFEGDGSAEVVRHPHNFLGGHGMGLPESLSPDEIVRRAEWLADTCPAGRYNLVGSNCEHVANWCITGWYFESLQARRWFALHGLLTALLLLTWRWLSTRAKVFSSAALLATSVGTIVHHRAPYRFWKDVIGKWQGDPPPR
jgi:Lecithin retinol acyltransferase